MPDEEQFTAHCLQALATNVKWFMARRKMKVPALARATGLTEKTIRNFIRPEDRRTPSGERATVPSGTLANLMKIAWALGCQPWELMRDVTPARRRYFAAVEAALLDCLAAELAGEADEEESPE